MKKSALAVLLAIFALSLSSCGNNAADEQVTAETVQTTLAETAAEITETETETTTTTTVETTSETTTETETETVTETEKVCTCTSDFQHACCEYLNCHIPFCVYFGDINGDETPEAVVGKPPFLSTAVLYETEKGMQVLELTTMSGSGSVAYIADTKQILLNPRRTSEWHIWGYEEYRIYSWNGTDYEETSSVYRKPGYYGGSEEYSEYGQAYIDGEEVDNDTFEIRLAEAEKLCDENMYFSDVIFMNDENFESYMKENFPCFDNWDWDKD